MAHIFGGPEEIQEFGGVDDCSLSTIFQMSSISPAEVIFLEAARENNTPRMFVLSQQRGFNADITDNTGKSAVHWSAIHGNMEALESLIKFNADMDQRDKYGMTPLLWAAWCGHTKLMIRLIKEDDQCVAQTNKKGMNILHCAASNDRSHVIEFIGECLMGFQFQSKDRRGMTALHVTCLKGFNESTEILLRFSTGNLNAVDNSGCTPLHYACRNGHVDCVKKLMILETNLEIDDNLGYTPFHMAAHNNRLDVVELLIKDLTSDGLNRTTHKHQTPLIMAAIQGHERIVKLLIRHPQVDVNAKDEHGNTACHLLSRKMANNFPMMKLLLSSGRCDVNIKNEAHQIPLHVAIENSQVDLVVLLIKAGSNIESRNKAGLKCLELAVRTDEISLVDVIIEAERIQSVDGKCFQNVADNSTWRFDASSSCARKEQLKFEGGEADAGEENCRIKTSELREPEEIPDITFDVTTTRNITTDDTTTGCIANFTSDEITNYDEESRDIGRISVSSETMREEPRTRSENEGQKIEVLKESKKSTPEHLRDLESKESLFRKMFWEVAHSYMKQGDWKKLSHFWNFDARHVNAIQHQFSASHKHRSHGYRLLMIWLHSFQELHPHENPTKNLFEAFIAIGRDDIAVKIRKNLSGDSNRRCTLS